MKPSHLAIFAFLLLSVLCWTFKVGIRFNNSESLPHRLYISTVSNRPEKGQIVAFQHPKTEITFAKMIAGLPGDLIEVKNEQLLINGMKVGAIMQPFKAIESKTIPNGFYFLIGEHPESFDSRYEEFGLIPEHQIKERLWPIF
jgi:conjugal transfer pilin signal peptidase TrbI